MVIFYSLFQTAHPTQRESSPTKGVFFLKRGGETSLGCLPKCVAIIKKGPQKGGRGISPPFGESPRIFSHPPTRQGFPVKGFFPPPRAGKNLKFFPPGVFPPHFLPKNFPNRKPSPGPPQKLFSLKVNPPQK